jgi:hypothetical protein
MLEKNATNSRFDFFHVVRVSDARRQNYGERIRITDDASAAREGNFVSYSISYHFSLFFLRSLTIYHLNRE